MSFECRHLYNSHCDLRNKPCQPGDKGCVLVRAGAWFIGGKPEDSKKDQSCAEKDSSSGS